MQDGIVSFCEHQHDNGGNLWKTFQFLDEKSKNAINKIAHDTGNFVSAKDNTFTRLTGFLRKGDGLANIPKANGDIIAMFNKAKTDKDLKGSLDIIENNLNNSSPQKNNILRVAEFFKSIPDFLNIGVVIGFLGYGIPKFNIAHTKKLHENQNDQQDQPNTQKKNKVTFNSANPQSHNSNINQFNSQNINSDLFAKFQN